MATNPDTSRFDFQKPYLLAAADVFSDKSFRGVFWYGAAGAGKTYCGEMLEETLLQRQLIDRTFSGTALELVAETQAAMSRVDGARTLYEMIQEIKRASFVRLDDLGREREDYGQSVMFTILDTALNSKAFVLVTANRSAKELGEYYKGDGGLRSRLSALQPTEWPAESPNLRKPQ